MSKKWLGLILQKLGQFDNYGKRILLFAEGNRLDGR